MDLEKAIAIVLEAGGVVIFKDNKDRPVRAWFDGRDGHVSAHHFVYGPSHKTDYASAAAAARGAIESRRTELSQ